MGKKPPPPVVEDPENEWRHVIENAVLDDETWIAKVIMIEAAGADQDRIYINKFEAYAAEEKRFVIKNICKTETIFMVNQLGGEKKVKDDNLRVFEEGQAYLKEKKPIPSDILALIIKHLILKMKEEYLFIKRQRLETKEGLKRESLIMVHKDEVRGSVSKKVESQEGGVSVQGKSSRSGLDIRPVGGKKYNTSLRLRGEEWRDKIYVDDYPIEGPNLYVALTGFLDEELPVCLLKIGIPLTAIVQLRIDPEVVKVPSSLNRIAKRHSQTELFSDTTLRFWEQLQDLRVKKATTDIFKNTAFIIFCPPYKQNKELQGNPEVIYNELCYLMYDIQDLSRQHEHFIHNMMVIDIPEEQESPKQICDYHSQIDKFPLECITMYLILDSILQTVCDNLEINTSTRSNTINTLSSSPQAGESVKVKNAKSMVKDVFSMLCKSDGFKQYRVTYGEEYEKNKDPILIKHGDLAKLKTFHLRNLNLDNVVWSSLFSMPINNLWRNTTMPTEELEAKINFHLNVLTNCFERDNLETAEMIRLIHLLACRKLYNNRSCLTKTIFPERSITAFKKSYLNRSEIAEPIPKCPSVSRMCSSALHVTATPNVSKEINEYSIGASNEALSEMERIKLLFDCPDLTELVSAAEIANQKPLDHMIDDYEYFEDFSGTCAFQVLLDAFNDNNCVNCKYCEVTDCYILMFYNSYDKEGVSREEWRNHIDTPVALQDFFDFVIDEHYEWIKQEEHFYDESLKLDTETALKDSMTQIKKSCIENTDIEAELIIEGSLKYQEFERDKEPPISLVSVDDISPNSKKTATTITVTTNSKLSKKAKSTPRNVIPYAKPDAKENEPSEESVVAVDIKPFLGYSLGDRRIEVFGKECTFFSKDGSKVSTGYKLFIPTNQEYISLCFVPGNKKTEFRLHKMFGEHELTPYEIEICDSFRVSREDEMIINVKKQLYFVERLQSIDLNLQQNFQNNNNISTKSITKLEPIMDAKFYYSFTLGWSNGLMCESVYNDKSSTLSHIKQYYTNPLPHLQEDMRCITSNGEVVIFHLGGNVQILHPEGTITLITKCEKKIIANIPIYETHSDHQGKKKKDKGKPKTQSKVKLPTVEDETISKEYELLIQEFEIIETSGSKKKWAKHVGVEIEKLLIRTSTDYCQGEIYSKRSDGTNTLFNKDGVQIVTFPNGTRIITYFVIEDNDIFTEWTIEELQYYDLLEEVKAEESAFELSQKSKEDSIISPKTEDDGFKGLRRNDGFVSIKLKYIIEHENFATVNVNKSNETIRIDSPNNTSLIIDSDNNYEINLDSTTTAKFDGEMLNIDYVSCQECHVSTKCEIKINDDVELKKKWLRLTDPFGKKISVTYEGKLIAGEDIDEEGTEVAQAENDLEEVDNTFEPIGNAKESCQESRDQSGDYKSESSFGTHYKCNDLVLVNYPRFFVLHRDLTCSEIINRVLINDKKTSCQWQQWCSFHEHDALGDHRKLYSILTPVNLTETEKWLMESSLAGKPTHLEYKDVNKDSGKGFYHWMRPYKRFVPQAKKPANVLQSRQPKAFVVRTVQKQWNDEDREELKGTAELRKALLKYRIALETNCEMLMSVPLREFKTIDDQQSEILLQGLNERIYEDLKSRLDDDILSRTRATITTRPAPLTAIEDEMDEEQGVQKIRIGNEAFIRTGVIYLPSEEVGSQVAAEEQPEEKETDDIDKLSPNLAKYWRQRVEAAKEETFYKYLLRAGSLPPYFQNLLGGAIWWGVNNLATNATFTAERKKSACVCSPTNEGVESDTPEIPFM